MKQKLFDNANHPKKCATCIYARIPMDGSEILCEKKGIVNADDSCRKYEYDPLKRIPQKTRIDTGFSAEDFEI